MTTTADRIAVLQAIDTYCEVMQALGAERMRDHYPTLYKAHDAQGDPYIKVYADEPGRKYTRIISTQGSSRSVHCFVKNDDGTVYKAASWKAPTLNFPRGNVVTGLDDLLAGGFRHGY